MPRDDDADSSESFQDEYPAGGANQTVEPPSVPYSKLPQQPTVRSDTISTADPNIIQSAEQEQYSAVDVDQVIWSSHLIGSSFTSVPFHGHAHGARSELLTLHFHKMINELGERNSSMVIVHPTVYTKPNDLEHLLEQHISRGLKALEDGKMDTSNCKIIHIVPDVVEGIIEKHIRLRVIEQNLADKENIVTCLGSKTANHLFDPKSVGGPQNVGDIVNCGRYVSAMAIQAAGLAIDGIPISTNTLKASPAIERALHFNTLEDAKKGLHFAYVGPAMDQFPESIIWENVQKIRCLMMEYQARIEQDRPFHGTNVTPAKDGYGKASLFTSCFGTFTRAFTAKEKLEAAAAFLNVMVIGKAESSAPLDLAALSKNQEYKTVSCDFSKAPKYKAANQGELGKCVNAIIKAQARLQYTNEMKEKAAPKDPSPF
ncbi:MAG: hypothetical protein A3I77_05560 [Gammaproteobacteria bacterium RIFCSPLOWO2_02_FULL_42_14]|nr:MAG: hypothetical protein A3B71_00555 [Gammaproteobacteria bacterium RIFCSPHIGHO2_02_FULL_42_43]OGT28327.1 MAG: hypothetical protein A2624_05590 [Gammaproteobacteria bacterium RIFCSPHIGHO2_01_FULL_42_8]OGT53664.1 MAG: hypothetical protein A3E54_00300 [Gammaproteobacteria bacterium RIFCSPHIGHO2_12_FULL_41_25]OGT62729.1 MAG: hypothetical protein A3I77_05560 [Gammaproteobacteria bacterium RIFCSPLOWO2_02_FULL_42_14]OGT85610.1 MAG: hypothetical protein A3G86_02340 [Gammaproteobacteria bacterium R